MSVQKHYN